MTLYLMYCPLDVGKFNLWARDRGLGRRKIFDYGLGLHTLLSSMFGKSVVQPFRYFANSDGSGGSLYGYSALSLEQLREQAAQSATPDCLNLVDVEKIAIKALPAIVKPGTRIGFDLKVRPVCRVGNGFTDETTGITYRKGSEMDVFQNHMIKQGRDITKDQAADNNMLLREEIYRQWLLEKLGDGVEMPICRMVSFERTKVIRGAGRVIEGPDVTVQGDFIIKNSDGFSKLLLNGIGRHKAYGYGMVLLRPAQGG